MFLYSTIGGVQPNLLQRFSRTKIQTFLVSLRVEIEGIALLEFKCSNPTMLFSGEASKI